VPAGDLMFVRIDYHHLTRSGDIQIESRSAGLDLECLSRPGQVDVRFEVHAFAVDYAQRLFRVGHVDEMRAWVIADVVGIVGKFDGLQELIRGAVEDIAEPARAEADIESLQIGCVGKSLRSRLAGELLRKLARFQIYDVDRVINLVGEEESSALAVNYQVVQLPRPALEHNRLHQFE